jgi:hypothetical protein
MIYINFNPKKWIKKGLAPSKNPSEWRICYFASLKIKIFYLKQGLKYRYLYKLICMSIIQLTDSNIRKEEEIRGEG